MMDQQQRSKLLQLLTASFEYEKCLDLALLRSWGSNPTRSIFINLDNYGIKLSSFLMHNPEVARSLYMIMRRETMLTQLTLILMSRRSLVVAMAGLIM
jgi:hypothetical protein